MYTYHASPNELREQASKVGQFTGKPSSQYSDRYNDESLLTIPCAPQCMEVWKDGQQVKESEFEVQQWCNNEATLRGENTYVTSNPKYFHIKCPCCTFFAYPIHQEQESEDELWKDAAEIIDRYKDSSYTLPVIELRKHFQINRRKQ